MADTKISGLAPVTDVQNSDEYVVARAGANKKITGANLKSAMPGGVAAARTLTAGAGLAGGGDLSADRSFAVNVDGATLEIATDTVRVKDGGITAAKVAADVATQAELDAHTADTTAAHAASAVAFTPTGTVAATDVQAAIAEVASEAAGGAARVVEIKVIDDATAVTTGEGKAIICIPAALNGCNLTAAHAFVTTVSSSGLPSIGIRNATDSVEMLTTNITIDASEFTSYTAATAPVIDAAHDDMATGDLIAVDVDAAGTGAKGLGVILTFQLP